MSHGDIVRRESLSELRQISAWFRTRYGLTITIIGGWAVYAYNPYLGSFDIDCLGPNDPFTSQLNIYMNANGYVREPESPFGAASESWRKPVRVGTTEIDSIIIDACDFGFHNFFKENPSREIPYSLCIRREFLTDRPIGGEYFWVPRKELLFLYKIKAARDRHYVLTHENLPSGKQERLKGKIDKDYSDLVALLDPRPGIALNGGVLGDLIGKYDLWFITDTIANLSDHPGIMQYAAIRMSDKSELEQWINKILYDSGIK